MLSSADDYQIILIYLIFCNLSNESSLPNHWLWLQQRIYPSGYNILSWERNRSDDELSHKCLLYITGPLHITSHEYIASGITGNLTVCSTICLGWNQRKHQSWCYCPYVSWIHGWLVDSCHKGPVMKKTFHTMTSSWAKTKNLSGNLVARIINRWCRIYQKLSTQFCYVLLKLCFLVL